jgi:hypothetical protein
MTRNEETFYVVGGIAVTVERVMDLVVSALEGGSNYWYYITESCDPIDESKVPEGEWNSIERCVWGGGYLKICDKEAYFNKEPNLKTWLLNEDALKKGLELMVTKEYIKHFADFVQENEDANTADIFLQLCLFGEIIYG